MKRIFFLTIWLFAALLFIPDLAHAQVVVPEKPVPPQVKLKAPPRPGDNYVLIPGRWMWHRQTRMYVWVGPVWAEKPEGKIWVPGYWQQVPRGWKWVPGYWKKEFRSNSFFRR